MAEVGYNPDTWRNTLSYAATALEASSDNGDQYCARQIREYLASEEDELEVEYEYGTRWNIKGNPESPFPEYRVDYVVDYPEDSREYAEKLIADDAAVMEEGEKRGILIRRPVFNAAWEEVNG